TLSGRAEAMRPGGQPFLVAEGTVPINLALSGVTGSRFPANRQIALNITADSLPLDMVPALDGYIANMRGKVTSSFKLAGTLNHPVLTGQFNIHQGQARVVLAGITLNGIEASIRMLGDTVVIDSIAASNRGRIILTGGIGLQSLTQPSFDLRLVTQNAELLHNEHGQMRVISNLTMIGPFKDPHIAGDVRLREGVIYIPPSENKNLIGSGDPALFNVLDTAVMADRDVFVRSREATIEVYTEDPMELHVNRAKESLVIDGVLLTERGEYTFMTRRFNVKRGSATFVNTSEINPTLQAQAEYVV